MNIAESAIKYNVITYMFVFLITVGGFFALDKLGRLEDPEFTIKEAKVVTAYPGATPEEVEQEVTDVLETAIQELPQLKRIKQSISKAGQSSITVEIKDKYDKHTLPQVWDELRRKVGDAQSRLPPGTKPSIVYDDFGDVYGILVAVTGEGFSYAELRDIVDDIRRELLLVNDVAKINLAGIQPEIIYVEIPRTQLAQLGISREAIGEAIVNQNLVTGSGSVEVGDEYIRIDPTGTLSTLEDVGNIMISQPASQQLLRLGDIAEISRDYQDPPSTLIRYNGKPAITLGISTVMGGDVVRMGEALTLRAEELQAEIPLGVEIGLIYIQSQRVIESVSGFINNLLQALGIVLVVLVIFMGMRSGLIIGAILLLTIGATLIIMWLWGIQLQRISLGALIIALGMLVDNAIVVTDGILVSVEQGMDKIKAASETVRKTMWPLLGATLVAILAFAAIGLSPDATGEYCRSLFQVILASLFMSWLLAITVAPLLCTVLLKTDPSKTDQDPYAGNFYQKYKHFLLYCLKERKRTTGAVLALLALAIFGFQFVDKSFFPANPLPIYYVDFWKPAGTSLYATERDMQQIYEHLKDNEEIEFVASFVGSGAPRFMLTYSPEEQFSSYGFQLIGVKNPDKINSLMEETARYLYETFPDTEPKVKQFSLGTGGSGGKIQARFSGPDATVLQLLAEQAQQILHQDKLAKYIRDDWRQRVKVVRPQLAAAAARRSGITRPEINRALKMNFDGTPAGLYRERNRLLPIVIRPPAVERQDIADIRDVYVWSPTLQTNIPIGQVITDFKTEWEDPLIYRRNRKRTLTVHADAVGEQVNKLFSRIRPQIEAIELPVGYSLEWGGEYEDSKKAQAGLSKALPMALLLMVVMIICLFNAIRQPLIIISCVPFAIIGVTFGLLLFQRSFGFMAILGFLSLIGMLIKNAVVLIDEIDLQIGTGKDRFQSIVDASISRFRPVLMAAVTTIFGMIPLLWDVFFVDMAVTIMFGLAFGTVLTLIVVPVFYEMFFKIPTPKTTS